MSKSIDDLPTELLLPIFEYASLDDRPTGQSSPLNAPIWTVPARRDPSTSTYISQVCSRWRHLSWSHQAMWTQLPRSHQRLTNLYLSRCASALDVEIRPEHLNASMKHEDVQTIFDLVPRASSLFISCKPGLNAHGNMSALIASRKYPSIRSVLRTLEILNAPRLEDLRMDLQWEADVANIFVEVPRRVFGGQTLEKLRSVRFNYVLLRTPRTFLWPALRTAELTNSQAWDSAASFVSFFTGVPLLEDFKFTRHYGGISGGLPALDTTSVQGLPPLRSIPMVNLKSFMLHGPYYDMFFTLAILEIPCTALVSLTLTGRWIAEYAQEKLQIMRDALTGHFSRAIQEDACFDSITFHGRTMSASYHPNENTFPILPPSFTLSVIPEDGLFTTTAASLALSMLCSHPVFTRTPNLTIISIPNEHDANPSNSLHVRDILCIFDTYKTLRNLTLHGHTPCSALMHQNWVGSTSTRSLATLRIVGVQLGDESSSHAESLMVWDVLGLLRKIGDEFERLELERCVVGEMIFGELREGLGAGRVVLMECAPSI